MSKCSLLMSDLCVFMRDVISEFNMFVFDVSMLRECDGNAGVGEVW